MNNIKLWCFLLTMEWCYFGMPLGQTTWALISTWLLHSNALLEIYTFLSSIVAVLNYQENAEDELSLRLQHLVGYMEHTVCCNIRQLSQGEKVTCFPVGCVLEQKQCYAMWPLHMQLIFAKDTSETSITHLYQKAPGTYMGHVLGLEFSLGFLTGTTLCCDTMAHEQSTLKVLLLCNPTLC